MRKDYNLEKRKFVIGGFIVVIVAIYLFKLFDLQILDDKYSEIAVSNARSTKITHPSRGQIYDRNGNLVVYNEPAYDLVLVPKDVQEFDTTTMCKILQLKREDFDLLWKNMSDPKKNKNYSATTPQPLVQNLDSTTYGRLQEILYRFPGFDISQRIIRRYNYIAAANILGDIREVNAEDIERDTDNYYIPGDYTGDLGVEKSYEKYLRGVKGKEILIRDARGKIKGRYNDGKDDVQPIAGKDLQQPAYVPAALHQPHIGYPNQSALSVASFLCCSAFPADSSCLLSPGSVLSIPDGAGCSFSCSLSFSGLTGSPVFTPDCTAYFSTFGYSILS